MTQGDQTIRKCILNATFSLNDRKRGQLACRQVLWKTDLQRDGVVQLFRKSIKESEFLSFGTRSQVEIKIMGDNRVSSGLKSDSLSELSLHERDFREIQENVAEIRTIRSAVLFVECECAMV